MSSKVNGTPCRRFPKATPKTSAGTAPPTKSPQSQALRQRASATLLRYSKPTGRKNSAKSTSRSAQ